MLEEKVERLRKLQKECRVLMDDICDSLQGKCKETLFDVLETVLENVDEFPDTESAVRMINEFATTRHSSKTSSRSKKHSKKEAVEM